jgi:hypothetical protein
MRGLNKGSGEQRRRVSDELRQLKAMSKSLRAQAMRALLERHAAKRQEPKRQEPKPAALPAKAKPSFAA